MTSFRQKVFSVIREIPRWEVCTYKEVAERIGSPRAFRAVGSILKTNFDPTIPCHRVICSDEKLGNYNRGGTRHKRRMLTIEGYL